MSVPEVSEKARALLTVQRRVGAIVYFTVVVHGVVGLIGVAFVVDDQGRHADAMMLLAMSGVFGLITYAGVRLILARSLWSPAWLALAIIPTVVAFFVI